MGNEANFDEQFDYTLTLLKKIWVVLVIGLYALCFYNEYKFPGAHIQPLKGEEILWKMERVLYFGLLGVGVLTDIVQMRLDRNKAFLFLFASLILGGLSTSIGALHFKSVQFLFGN